jgi:hypothetical protein
MGHERSCAAPGEPNRTLEAQQQHDTFRNRDPGDHGKPTYLVIRELCLCSQHVVAERERPANLYSSGAVLCSMQYVLMARRSPSLRRSLKDNIMVDTDSRTSFREYSALRAAGFVHTTLVQISCFMSCIRC